MTSATRDLSHDDIPSGSTILAISLQLAVSLGFAAVSALLTALVAVRAPLLGPAGLGAAYDLDPATRVALAPDLAAAMQLTLVLPAALTALSLAVAVTAMRRAPLVAAR